MSELIVPSRRGFLIGLGAAICTPVVIRTPGLLMPIKPELIGCGIETNELLEIGPPCGLDEYSLRVLAPIVEKLQKAIAVSMLYQFDMADAFEYSLGSQWNARI